MSNLQQTSNEGQHSQKFRIGCHLHDLSVIILVTIVLFIISIYLKRLTIIRILMILKGALLASEIVRIFEIY